MILHDKNENYLKYSEFSPFEKQIYFQLIYKFLRRLNIEYPGFNNWYNKLFNENRILNTGREIIVCEKNNKIAGVVILKASGEEKKICTLRVTKEFQRQGIGKKLMELSFEWLEEDKPLLTMHSNKQREFIQLLKYYDFKLEQKSWHYYSIFSTELVYNGVLPEKKMIFNKFELMDINLFYDKFLKLGGYNIRR